MSHDARPSPADAAPGTPPVHAARLGGDPGLQPGRDDRRGDRERPAPDLGGLRARRRRRRLDRRHPRGRAPDRGPAPACHRRPAQHGRRGGAQPRGRGSAGHLDRLPGQRRRVAAREAREADGPPRGEPRFRRRLLRTPDRRRARRAPGRAHHAPLHAGPLGEARGGRHPRAAARAQHDQHPDARGAPGRLPRARLLRRGDDPDRGLGFRAAPRAPGQGRLRRRAARAPALLAELDHPRDPAPARVPGAPGQEEHGPLRQPSAASGAAVLHPGRATTGEQATSPRRGAFSRSP